MENTLTNVNIRWEIATCASPSISFIPSYTATNLSTLTLTQPRIQLSLILFLSVLFLKCSSHFLVLAIQAFRRLMKYKETFQSTALREQERVRN